MADFVSAFNNTMGNEKGYANNPKDPGGETYRGISRVYHPAWEGWALVDAAKRRQSGKSLEDELNSDVPLQSAVMSFYAKEFWKFDSISDQNVANKVFDMAVQEGFGTAVKLLQNALRFVLARPELKIDGLWGPQTEALTNAAKPDLLHFELRAQMAIYYCEHSDPVFRHGHMRRAVE